MKELFKRCNPLQLRMLMADVGPVTSVDFVNYFPPDVTEEIFSWLDVRSLCCVAYCSRLWRKRANSDNIWKAMCERKGWLKFGSNKALPEPSPSLLLSPRNSKRSTYSFESSELLLSPPTCHWKDVYKRACQLEKNWNSGCYTVLPLLRGHKKRVLAVDCAGVLLVSGSSDNSVRIWDLETHECSHVLENHSDEVTCVKIKAGLVVSGSADGLVRVFNALTGRLFGELKGHRNSVDCLAFDGDTILSGSADGSVHVWNVHTGKCLHVLNGHSDEVKCIYMVGSLAVSGSWDSNLRVWDLATGICKHTLVGHSEGVYCCQFDEDRVVSGSADASIRIWDTGSGRMKHVLTGHKAEIVKIYLV
jgi:F-box/WD-40 domain protein 7